ncbi:toxin co-regulated pilus biosynthesis Q family protein (plasmid) [Salmonella enterica subsp. salamae]|uniref:toxin co-regulated pilus biosynthesis Q family protein n=1 Tax=Salmonella enterica TaxID=28901 RepID=UPI00112EFC7B|nr:toxin co-regulated pilus biosynthesis Q family protein [Salmonella enterica]EBP3978175.1 hypothetical protein [Salmonella enterica subsp. enterica]QVP66145.1 toxin co-regulated pilus biosynthesis Q family protein [Salmonella enterica subsp. salamae]ECO4668115.1 hypothetical protein [Salmonella enterica]EFP2748988.1 hypothetical protein [Salmonella enterica]EGT8498630.1 hypothetical protein [Salmonella enterica]
MDTIIKQQLSVTLISLCVVASLTNVHAGMLNGPGNINNAPHDVSTNSTNLGKLRTVSLQTPITSSSVELTKPEKKTVQMPPITPPLGKTWLAYKGESLQSLTVRWADYVGYQVAWDAPYDYQINASFALSGDFPGVIKQLFDEFGNSDRPMKVDIYNQQKLVHVGPL